jgi:hypothetical protein
VTKIIVERGGHYEWMINQGQPQAIDWLKKMAKRNST